MTTLKERLQQDVKDAMKSQDKARLNTLRLITAAIKQREVDERITLDDTQVIATLDKMVKQRRESIEQFTAGNRPDLVEKETQELTILQTYMPEQLSEEEVKNIIKEAVKETGSSEMKDMGKIMAQIKPKLQGRFDMTKVSLLVKQQLT